MKKPVLILMAAVLLLLSLGCGNDNTLSALPKEYPSEVAAANGDYVNVHGTIYNGDVLTDFLVKTARKEDAFIRIVMYTVEGDPIIMEVSYTKDGFTVTTDTTRDKFGEPAVTTKTYQNLLLYQDTASGTEYVVVTDLPELTKELFDKGFEDGAEITILTTRPIAE